MITGSVALAGALILLVAGNSRDEGSYQFGWSSASIAARPIWQSAQNKPQLLPNIRSEHDACRMAVEVERDGDFPVAEILRKLDFDDVIDGCTDALRAETPR